MIYRLEPLFREKRWHIRILCQANEDGEYELELHPIAIAERKRNKAIIKGVQLVLDRERCTEIHVILDRSS